MATENLYIPLINRSVISISGKDARHFLQGIITNDMQQLSPEHALYGLMLTPQGKYLYDFFIVKHENDFLMDCAKIHKETLIHKLSMYKLRSEVEIKDQSDHYEVVAALGSRVSELFDYPVQLGQVLSFCKGIGFIDPRDKDLYARVIVERENHYKAFEVNEFSLGKFTDYEQLRIDQLIPDGIEDLRENESFPLDYGMDHLNAIDFEKGCYVGQEVTARTKHRGTIRKSIFKVSGSSLPKAGTNITMNDKKIGIMGSSCNGFGLALLRTDLLDKTQGLHADGNSLTLCK